MNQDEFISWADYHGKLFSGFAKWYAEQDREAVKAWERGLERLSLDAAKQASEEMLHGDLEEPRGYTKHLQSIRRRAYEIDRDNRPAEQGPQFIDGQRVYSCRLCNDSGIVYIYHPMTVEAVMNGTFDDDTIIRFCDAGCTCGQLNRFRLKLPRFAPKSRYRCLKGHRNDPTGEYNVVMIAADTTARSDEHIAALVAGIEACV